jgi:hypothetical protein
MGWHWLVPTARSDDRWRSGRRLLDRSLRPGAIALYRPMQQARTNALLSRLLANPHQWQAHIELLVHFLPGPSLHFIPEILKRIKCLGFRGS